MQVQGQEGPPCPIPCADPLSVPFPNDFNCLQLTTSRIAERASVSVGSLYQYFPNKDSLLAGLLAQHHEDVHELVKEALVRLSDQGISLDVCIRKLFGDLVSLHQANPELTRALSASVLRESEAAEGMKDSELGDSLSHQVVQVLAARTDVRMGDPVVMAMVLKQALSQLSRWLVHDLPPGLDQAVVLEEIVLLLVRYIRS